MSHFSATKLDIAPVTLEYYPGLAVKFTYYVTDRLGNIIPEEIAEDTVVTLETDSFITLMEIDWWGICKICDEGVLLSDLSISNDIGTEYTMNLSTDNDFLLLSDFTISFDVIGCPIGFGADSNNNSCDQCDTLFYNVEPDWTRQCLSCDPEDNTGIVMSDWVDMVL